MDNARNSSFCIIDSKKRISFIKHFTKKIHLLWCIYSGYVSVALCKSTNFFDDDLKVVGHLNKKSIPVLCGPIWYRNYFFHLVPDALDALANTPWDRSSHPEVFLRNDVLKICSKFTGEHPCQSVISIKLLENSLKLHFVMGALL